MEHRWGERVAVRHTVQLAGASAAPIAGSLENVSVSGAFVRTEGRKPPRGPVEVILEPPGHAAGRARDVRLAAYVIRETAAGIGIEWCEFAPRTIRELMIRDRRGGGARARARAPQSMRYSREPSMAMQPTAASTGPPVLAAAARLHLRSAS